MYQQIGWITGLFAERGEYRFDRCLATRGYVPDKWQTADSGGARQGAYRRHEPERTVLVTGARCNPHGACEYCAYDARPRTESVDHEWPFLADSGGSATNMQRLLSPSKQTLMVTQLQTLLRRSR